MSVTLTDETNELIRSIAKCQGSGDYKIDVKSGSMKGDGYLGIINTVQIQYTEPSSKELNLIMKTAMSGEEFREITPVRKAYEREIYMYKTIFPEFRKFSEEIGIKNSFTETAKYYGSLLADKQECILLENLKEKNFQLWNRKLPMNEEHMTLVFETYGKMHGTGFALKILQPEKYKEITKDMTFIFQKENPSEADLLKFQGDAKQVFGNGFLAVAGNEKATKALARFAQNQKFFREEVRKIDRYSTILHGDCWCNNMMFKYEDLEHPLKPTEICLLDWQLAHVASPILDLSYFFYASASKEMLHSLKKFLKIYHEVLARTLKEAGIDPDEVLTFEELETHWKIYSKYGLFMTLFVMRVILGEAAEAPDLSELAKSGKNLFQSISSSESNIEEVNKRIADLVVFMDEHNYL